MQSSYWLLGVLVIGLILRIIGLNQSLWLDEATSILAASNFSYQQIINQFSPGDFHPPAYYLILKAWLSIFGTSEIAARSLSVLLGTVTIYLVYSLATKLFDKKVGTVSSLLIATSPLHIYYSQEARMYVLETLLVVKIILLFVDISKKQDKLLTWVGLFAYSALLIYTDYLPALIFPTLALFLIIFDKKTLLENLVKWIAFMFAVLVSYVPWIPTLKFQLVAGSFVRTNTPLWWETLGRTDFKQLALVPLKFAVGRVTSYNKALYYGLSAIPVALYGLAVAKTAVDFRKTALVWLWMVVPLAISAVLGLYLSVFSYFRFLFVLPAFYILAAYGASKLGKPVTMFLVTCNVVASLLYLTNPSFQREDWRGAVSHVEQNSDGIAASVFVSHNQRDPYFYYQKSVVSYGPIGWEEGNFSKIWLFRYVQPIFDPKDDTKQRVESLGYKKVREKDFNGITVWEYRK